MRTKEGGSGRHRWVFRRGRGIQVFSERSGELGFPLFFLSLSAETLAGIISSPGYFIHARLTPLRKSPVAGPCAVNGACDPRLHNAIVPDACNSIDCWNCGFNTLSDFSFLKPCISYRLIDGYCRQLLVSVTIAETVLRIKYGEKIIIIWNRKDRHRIDARNWTFYKKKSIIILYSRKYWCEFNIMQCLYNSHYVSINININMVWIPWVLNPIMVFDINKRGCNKSISTFFRTNMRFCIILTYIAEIKHQLARSRSINEW